MLVWPAVRRGASGASISTLQATLLINQKNALVLDVREAAEYEKGTCRTRATSPSGARRARRRNREAQGEALIVVYDDGGNRSGRAATALRKQGFEQVFTLSADRRVAASRAAPGEVGGEDSNVLDCGLPVCLRAEMLLIRRASPRSRKYGVDLDSRQREEMMNKTGRRTVPQIYIGDTHVADSRNLRRSNTPEARLVARGLARAPFPTFIGAPMSEAQQPTFGIEKIYVKASVPRSSGRAADFHAGRANRSSKFRSHSTRSA